MKLKIYGLDELVNPSGTVKITELTKVIKVAQEEFAKEQEIARKNQETATKDPFLDEMLENEQLKQEEIKAKLDAINYDEDLSSEDLLMIAKNVDLWYETTSVDDRLKALGQVLEGQSPENVERITKIIEILNRTGEETFEEIPKGENPKLYILSYDPTKKKNVYKKIIVEGADIVNEAFYVLPCFIQEMNVLRKRYLLRRACGIQHQGPFVPGGSASASFLSAGVSHWRIILRCVVSNDHLIDITENVVRKAFPKLHQKGRDKRLFILVSGKSDEKLIIRVLADLFHQFPVRIRILFLDDQGTKRCAQRLSRHSLCAWKQRSVLFLDLVPRDRSGLFHPPVLRVHRESHGLVKI